MIVGLVNGQPEPVIEIEVIGPTSFLCASLQLCAEKTKDNNPVLESPAGAL